MKLIFKREKYVPKEVTYELILKKYMQSYLKWLYFQNPSCHKNLTQEEIVNYFFNKIEHPVWFKEPTFASMVEITEYFKQHLSPEQVELFDYYYTIKPKMASFYSEIKPNNTQITSPQKCILQERIDLNNLAGLCEEEADYLIGKLNEEKSV